MKWLLSVVAIIVLAIADRWLKLLALHGATRDYGWAQFTIFKNDALVFSWPAPNWVAIILMVFAIVAVLIVAWRVWRSANRSALLGCLLIVVGASSNLFDRFAYGFVIDWAYLGRWWPVFNMADVMIGIGVVLLITFLQYSRTSGFLPPPRALLR